MPAQIDSGDEFARRDSSFQTHEARGYHASMSYRIAV